MHLSCDFIECVQPYIQPKREDGEAVYFNDT